MPLNSATSEGPRGAAAGQPATVLFLDHTSKMGGGEIALLHLLQQLDKERFRPLLVLGEEGPLAEKVRASGVETSVIPLPAHVANTRKDSLGAGSLTKLRQIGAVMAYSWRLSRFMRSRRVSLVHTNSLKADIIGGIAGRLAGVPIVWHVRDRIESDYLPATVVRVFRLLCRIIPDFVVANSAATLDTLHLPGQRPQAVVHGGYALVQGSSAVVHDGVVAPAPIAKSNSAIRIGLVGRITRWKGQHVFLEAAAMVRSRFPSARFQIIGSAMFGEEAYEQEIRALSKSTGVDDCVDFLGFRTDVPALISELDILVHASITGEPFGQVIIEAMAAAKPVVATRGGGVPEIVREGLTGLLVPMGDARAMADAICELLSDPARAMQMGAAGRERVLHRFTVEVTARRLEFVFEKVLRRNGTLPFAPSLQEEPVLVP
jgi:glycosyltransferase involved in cell wall biosynthesis